LPIFVHLASDCGITCALVMMEMKVFAEKTLDCYLHQAAAFLQGTEGNGVKELHISAQGRAIHVATTMASQLVAEGNGEICKIETSYEDVALHGKPRGKCPKLTIHLKNEAVKKRLIWEIDLGHLWVPYEGEVLDLLLEAIHAGQNTFEYSARRQYYLVDLVEHVQINKRTGARRTIRCREEEYTDSDIDESEDEESLVDDRDDRGFMLGVLPVLERRWKFEPVPPRSKRLSALVEFLLSPAVQVPLPLEIAEEPARLSHEEVKNIFIQHVPGVRQFLFRGQQGNYSLNFLANVYYDGFGTFKGTSLDKHLLWRMRSIVHHAHAGKPMSAMYLKEVAEAFMECQAIQARVVERIGLQLRGIQGNFRSLVTRFIGEYKTLAIKMLASYCRSQGLCEDRDDNPTHYENRLTADLGKMLGLNADDVRRAHLDGHASQRFACLRGVEQTSAAATCRDLFDIEALIKALASEICTFDESCPHESLPRQFLEWSCHNLRNPHVVYDADVVHINIDEHFALAVLEALFIGMPQVAEDEMYGSHSLRDLFLPPDE